MGIAVEPPAGDRQRVQQVGVHWSCFGEDLGQPPARVDRQLGVLGDQLHRLASTAQWLTVDQHPPAVGRQVAASSRAAAVLPGRAASPASAGPSRCHNEGQGGADIVDNE